MISCYELRIGNYVLVEKDIKKVSKINSTTISTVDAEKYTTQPGSEHGLENIQPVLLTDDVLKQCGFIYHEYFKFWQLMTTGIRSEMDLNSDYDVIDFARRPIFKNLRSLHELQNIYFMLKGRELAFPLAQLLTDNYAITV